MPAFNSTTPNKLMRRIGTPDCPAIVDVRIPDDFNNDPLLIPGSIMVAHDRIAEVSAEFRRQETVLVCHKGLKLSHGSAALLRCDGVHAQVLEGGMDAWHRAKLPRMKPSVLPNLSDRTPSTWVTRHRPKVDRIACAWLIRRFIDRKARFLFVPPSEVEAVADRFGATAFDTPSALWTHDGDLCTFDVMLRDTGLSTPELDKMATVIRAADTDRLDLAPQAAGLLAISLGLSRAHKSDLEQLDAGMVIYDALFRWARDAENEAHKWPERYGE